MSKDREDTVFDKIGSLIDDHRNKKNQQILDILTASIQDKFDDGTIEEQIGNDQVRFEIMTIEELNETLEEDGFNAVNSDYLESYLEDFCLDGNMIVYEHDSD